MVAALVMLALTRAEIVERFRAVPVVKLEGLVQVVADCPAEMRKQYQLPVAAFAAETCKTLYSSEMAKPKRFDEPGIVLCIGDGTNAVTNAVSRVHVRDGGAKYTRIYLPSPGHVSRKTLASAVARAYYLAVHGKEVDEATAWKSLMTSSPEIRAAESCRLIADWAQRGIYAEGMDDEEYLKISRKVLLPGQLTLHDLTQFASRLYLYPLSFDAPFCGKYGTMDFASAVRLREKDPSIRYAAFVKAKQVLIFGSGRGEGLLAAATAYAAFLEELGRSEKTDEELLAMLAAAEQRLKEAAGKK